VKSGSGVIQTLFYGGGGTNSGSPYRYYTRTQGVAAVVDLGRHGWLVAAMTDDPDEVRRRKQEFGLTCKDPQRAEGLLNAFGLDAAELVKLRAGKRELVDGNLPAFVWFPRGRPYTEAQQICPEEFSRVIGTGLSLKSAMIESEPDAPFKTVLESDAPWLAEMRRDQPRGYRWKPQGVTDRRPYLPQILFFENPGLAKP
jgi:hypothetical protein